MNKVDKEILLSLIPSFKKNNEDIRYITDRVYHKAVEFVSKINPKYFKDLPLCFYPSKWHTFIIDFGEKENELSLEIGYSAIGYFTEYKQVDHLPIKDEIDMKLAIINLETDLEVLWKLK